MTLKQRIEALEVQSNSLQDAIDALHVVLADLQAQMARLRRGPVVYRPIQLYDSPHHGLDNPFSPTHQY